VAARPISGTGHRQNVVERHRDVGDDDLGECLPEGFRLGGDAGRAGYRLAVQHPVHPAVKRVGAGGVSVMRAFPGLAVELPGHPQEEDAAGQHQTDDAEKLGRKQREDDAEPGRGGDAKDDRLAAKVVGESRGGHADDHRIVAGEHEVNDDDGEEGG
jgi:hypothetical protein